MRRAAVGLLLLLAVRTGSGAAQAPGDLPVAVRPWSPVVAVELRFSVGSADDPPGSEGRAALLGRVLERRIGAALGPERGRAAVEVDRSRTRIVLLAPADAWPEALAEAAGVIFRTPLPDSSLARARAEVSEALSFRRGSPVEDFRADLRGLVAGPDHPWARPVRGTPTGVDRVSDRALRELRSRAVTPAAVRVAVVGGAGEEERIRLEARSAVGLPDSDAPEAVPAGPAPAGADRAPADSAGGRAGPAWSSGDRVVRIARVTNRWTAVAFPVAPETSALELDLLRHALQRRLSRRPPPPELYGVEVETVDAPGGRVLQVVATVEAGTGAAWETRILDAVSGLARTPPRAELFTELRRSYRSRLLLELAAPEAEARSLLDGQGSPGPTDLTGSLWSLRPGDLARAARSLGPPRILQYGPEAVPAPRDSPSSGPDERRRKGPDSGRDRGPASPRTTLMDPASDSTFGPLDRNAEMRRDDEA